VGGTRHVASAGAGDTDTELVPRPVRPAPGRFSCLRVFDETGPSMHERRDMADTHGRTKPVREDKAAAVNEIADRFRAASATVITEYRGLSVSQITELRRALGGDTHYRVAKNTLVKIAATEAGVDGLDALFVGPTAVTFVNGDVVDAAKGLRNFAKDNPALVIKGGVFEGKALTADDVNKLADLESREVLLAKLAGAMKGSMSKAASLFQAPLSKTARLAQALADKQSGSEAA
jgi:large subunit ribosomal protein L10